mmetsp:Transcript_14170/g.15695  ORF Transcript_14170/g.15695 Transcript_14170/m.15695 type:complete len:121 (-) Transcript_14170:62-424(-)
MSDSSSEEEVILPVGEQIAYSGFLLKKTSSVLVAAKRRFFVLRGNVLSYFKDDKDLTASRCDIDLEGAEIIAPDASGSGPFHMKIRTAARTWELSCKITNVYKEWRKHLQSAAKGEVADV